MPSSSLAFQLHGAQAIIKDPGTTKTIVVDRSMVTCQMTSTTTETRTLAVPTRKGVVVTLHGFSIGGTITVTVTSGYDVAGNTTLVFSAAGQVATLRSVQTSSGTYVWRLEHASRGVTQQALAEIVITTNVITADEHGKTFYLDLAGGFVSTLPAVALGLTFTFIVKTAPTGSYTIVCPAAAALFKGQVLTNDVNSGTDSDFGTAGEATITLVLNKAVAGDRVVVNCDGTNWHVQAACSVFDAITIS